MAVLLITLLLAVGGLGPPRTAMAQSTPDCSGIPQYVRELGGAFDAFDIDLMTALTASDTRTVDGTPTASSVLLQGVLTAADELVHALERIEPPPVATHYHRTLLELDRLIAQWLQASAASDFSDEDRQGYEDKIEETAWRLDAYGTFAVSTCSEFQQVLDLANVGNPNDFGMPDTG
jgi:hypothetical protein